MTASLGSIALPGQRKSWLEYLHPIYATEAGRWLFTRDHYTGDVLDAGKIKTYLVKKAFGEHVDAFAERVKLADYANHFAAIVDGLAGMLSANDDKTSRTWQDETGRGLGDPADEGTTAGRLASDADGRGTSYMTLWKNVTTELLLTRRVWLLVDNAGTPERPRAVVRVLPAESVPNWLDDGSVAVLKETADGRSSIEEEPKAVNQFIRFTLAGWQRFELQDKQEVALVGPGNEGLYSYRDANGNPALPIFSVVLPLSRHVGWLLAKKQNAIFNRESDRDNLLRQANHPKLNIVARDEVFEKLVGILNAGGNALQVEPGTESHSYISPDSGPAVVASSTIESKVRDLYRAGLKDYGDAAAQKTATEARQDVAHGVGAFLALLASAVDAAENGVLWRIAQTEQKDTPDAFVAKVERSHDFAVTDPEAMIDKLRDRAFGKDAIVPLGNAGRVAAAKQIATYLGVEADAEELLASIEVEHVLGLMKGAVEANLPMPASVRVQLLKRLLEATQLVPEDGTAEGGPAMADVLADALDLAESEDTNARRSTESFGGGGFGGGTGGMIPPAPTTKRVAFSRDAEGNLTSADVVEAE